MLKLIPIALSALLLSAATPAPGAPLVDCNGNGVEDSLDIAYGSSSDLNGDGVPDECELRGDRIPVFQRSGRIFLCDSNSAVGWTPGTQSGLEAQSSACDGFPSPRGRAPIATL